jgi:hypothetical protein
MFEESGDHSGIEHMKINLVRFFFFYDTANVIQEIVLQILQNNPIRFEII